MNTNHEIDQEFETEEFDPEYLAYIDDYEFDDPDDLDEETTPINVMKELKEQYKDETDKLHFQNKKYEKAYRTYYEIEHKMKINLHNILKNPYLAYKEFRELYKKLKNKKSDYNYIKQIKENNELFIKSILKKKDEYENKIIRLDICMGIQKTEMHELYKLCNEQQQKIEELEQREVNIDTSFYTQTIRRQAQTIQYLQNELNKYKHSSNVENT